MAQRVLVVDDVEVMRAVIRRALTADGYEVDVASTLAEARALDPARYDAVLVDARLGAERGAELVEELQAADPVMARRCLVITGGPPGQLLDGVAYLRKPFRPDQLLAAVRALHQAGGTPAGRPAGGSPALRADPALADFLHDGPIQELAAAMLDLELIRRSLPPDQAPALDAVMDRLDMAERALRRLMDGEW